MNAVTDLVAHRTFAKPAGRRTLKIGLVNNMPDAALASTEAQFTALLASAAKSTDIEIHRFALNTVPRNPQGYAHLAQSGYCDSRMIADAGLDAVIVTGTEPKARDLRQEPYWAELSALFNWIERDGPPAIFSCLAAHAAVLHFDGIERQRLEHKRFGRFAHQAVGDHALTGALPPGALVAHSRWHDLNAETLFANGYRILTVAAHAGVELFVRQGRNAMLFFQGHPEYDAGALGREYKRDVKRFLRGESEIYPRLPYEVFGPLEAERLLAFEQRALQSRNKTLISEFPAFGAPSAQNGYGESVYRAFLQRCAGAELEPDRLAVMS